MVVVKQNDVQTKLEVENYELQMLVEMIYDSSYPESQVSTTAVLSPVCFLEKVVNQYVMPFLVSLVFDMGLNSSMFCFCALFLYG